jgi:hypothetical protein
MVHHPIKKNIHTLRFSDTPMVMKLTHMLRCCHSLPYAVKPVTVFFFLFTLFAFLLQISPFSCFVFYCRSFPLLYHLCFIFIFVSGGFHL